MKYLILSLFFIFSNLAFAHADLMSNLSWYRVIDEEGNFFETDQFNSSLEPMFWQDDVKVDLDNPESLKNDLFNNYLPAAYENGEFTYLRTEFGENEFDPILLYDVYDLPFYPESRHEMAMFGFQNEGRFAIFYFASSDSLIEIKSFYSNRYAENAYLKGEFNKLLEMIPEEFLADVPGYFLQYSDGEKRNIFLFLAAEEEISNCFVIITEKWK